MDTHIQFTSAELAQLHLLLVQDMESSRMELHHTAGRPYREYIKEKMSASRALLKKMEDALPYLRESTAD